MQIIIARRRDEFVRGRRFGPPMPSEAVQRHVDSAEFDDDVLAFRKLRDIRFPLLEDFRALSFVRSDSDDSAAVIEDNRRSWERLRQPGDLRQLRMVLPSLKAE